MGSRVRRPETKTLHISEGDWLLVKKHLNTGETRAMFRRMMPRGLSSIDETGVGLSTVIAYLLDWSITDAEDKPIVIRDLSPDDLQSALDMLEPESFEEVLRAVEAHHDAMKAEREQEKKVRNGSHLSAVTSPSPDVGAGAMSGSRS